MFSSVFLVIVLIVLYLCDMQQRKTFYVASLVGLAMLLVGCRSHYQLSGVERSRILVDSRYDVADASLETLMAPWKQEVEKEMAPVVGEAADYMPVERPESGLSNLLADILVWAGKKYGEQPDFGVYNMGGIRAAIAKGKVTVGDVTEVAPFENKIAFVSLKGSDVIELFRQMATTGGEAVSHGVQLVFTKDKQLRSALLNGQAIDPEREYRVASIDYLIQGTDKMEAFKKKTRVNSPQEESNNVRYIIMDYFREQMAEGKAVYRSVEGRIVIE